MLRACRRWARLLVFVIPAAISADTVTLKDGTVLQNVRTFLGGSSLFVVFKDGSVRAVLKSEVRTYMREEVLWKTEAPPPAPAAAKETALPAGDSGMRSQWSLVWRSALLPGWGQLHAGRKSAGIAAIAATGLTALYALNRNQIMKLRRAEYRENITLFLLLGVAVQPATPLNVSYANAAVNGAAFKRYDASVTKYRNGAALFGLVYVLQAAHAYVTGVDWVNENPSAARSFLGTEGEGLAFSLNASEKTGQGFSVAYLIRR